MGERQRLRHLLNKGAVSLLIPLSVAALGGCSTFNGFPERTPAPADDLQQLKPVIAADAITACLQTPTTQCRDRIVGARIYATDIQFSRFEEAIFQQTRTAGELGSR